MLNLKKIMGFIAISAVIGFVFISCDDADKGNDGDGGNGSIDFSKPLVFSVLNSDRSPYSHGDITFTAVDFMWKNDDRPFKTFDDIKKGSSVWNVSIDGTAKKVSIQLGELKDEYLANANEIFIASNGFTAENGFSSTEGLKIFLIWGFAKSAVDNDADFGIFPSIYWDDLNNKGRYFIYANKDGNIKGNGTDWGSETRTLNVNINLKAGWNIILTSWPDDKNIPATMDSDEGISESPWVCNYEEWGN